MPQEIERKFLVIGDAWRSLGSCQRYCQGYLPTQGKRTVRIRIAGNQGYLTLKGPAVGLVRPEFEYPIPVEDAQAILETLCDRPLIEKIRHRVPLGPVVWEIDEFEGDNAGLILAEVELDSEDQIIDLPEWIGQEVTGDPRYYNASLVKYSFKDWQ
ncbi:MAG: CYTH domain-containing protein [Cyanobacteria bacterium J06635_1]